MNKLEKFIYNRVKKNPKVKFFLRDSYQSICDMVPVSPKVAKYPIIKREGYYFGFHDKCPYSHDDSKLLAGKYNIPLRSPSSADTLTVGYFAGENHEDFNPITKTRSWNWHQGCQLQWRGTSDEIVFNDFDGNKNISRVVDVVTGISRNLSMAISSVSKDGKWGIGYSFERVQKFMPGYGYPHGSPQIDLDENTTKNDGLYVVDMTSGSSRLIITIAQLVDFEHDEILMKGGKHFVSHAIISPNNKRVVFLHRWIKDDIRHRWSRMFSCDLDGGNLYCFPTYEMVSHIAWKSGDELLAYCRLPNHKEGYVLFKDKKKYDWKLIGESVFNSDGHPSYDYTGRWIITDTYPDRFRRQTLILFDSSSEKRYDLAKLKHPKRFSQTNIENARLTCDLHPRWNRAGTTVCFDAVYSGKRSLCTMPLVDLL